MQMYWTGSLAADACTVKVVPEREQTLTGLFLPEQTQNAPAETVALPLPAPSVATDPRTVVEVAPMVPVNDALPLMVVVPPTLPTSEVVAAAPSLAVQVPPPQSKSAVCPTALSKLQVAAPVQPSVGVEVELVVILPVDTRLGSVASVKS